MNDSRFKNLSNAWLITSPHYSDGIIPDSDSDALPFIYSKAYDFCLGWHGDAEDGSLHQHLALRFDAAVSPSWMQNMLPFWHYQPVDIESWKMVVDYCRKDGIYQWKREKLPLIYSNPNPSWRPWQQRVLDLIDENEARKVICVVDSRGGSGKTFLALWHAVRNRAVYCPIQQYRDVMRQAYARPTRWSYFFDLPRALTNRNMKHIFAAAETIRNGYAYDDRYEWKDRYWSPVPVVIYTNIEPDASQLSSDRWIYIYPEQY